MGIREWFGVKQCKIHTQNCRTLEDLYQKIKDLPFEAGKPEIHMKEQVIAFPALDENNQVQIFEEKGQFIVIRSTIPTLESMRADHTSTIVSTSGNMKKYCMELCQKTADQINALHL